MKKKLKKRHVISAFLFLIFILLIVLIQNNNELDIDVKMAQFISNIRNDYLNAFFKIITTFASPIFLIILTMFILIIFKKKKELVIIPINLGITTLIVLFLKEIFKRPRPLYKLIEQGGYSFPSGHAFLSVSFYGFLIFLIWKYIKDKKIKIILSFILIILILLIGFSRMYLGVHYLSDVIAGYSIGIVYLIIFIEIINRKKSGKDV